MRFLGPRIKVGPILHALGLGIMMFENRCQTKELKVQTASSESFFFLSKDAVFFSNMVSRQGLAISLRSLICQTISRDLTNLMAVKDFMSHEIEETASRIGSLSFLWRRYYGKESSWL